MAEPEITSRAPEVRFQLTNIAPPTALYVSPADFLVVSTMGVPGGTTLGVMGRLLRPNGEVVPFRQSIIPSTNRTLVSRTVELTEGYLIGLTIQDDQSQYRRGQCYVYAQLHRARVGPGEPAYSLCQGYVYRGSPLGWPAGRQEDCYSGRGNLRSITGADPAAGAEVSETVIANVTWRLISVHTRLVSSATVATRMVTLVIDDGVEPLIRIPGPVSQVANESWRYTWAALGQVASDTPSGVVMSLLPPDLYLTSGYRIRTVTSSLQAGDNFDAPQLLVEEWLTPD
jgi:hypothetical protein